MNSQNEACKSVSNVDHLIVRLEQAAPDERAIAIENLPDIGEDTRTFLREHFEATEVLEQATRRPGQRLRVQAVRRPEEQHFDFELAEEIGRGASGSVWKAQDLRLRTTIAMKLFETLDAHQQ